MSNPYAAAPTRPINLEAEQALLGAILYDNAAHGLLGGMLKPEHFAEPFHQRLFAAIEVEIVKGHRAEPILLADRFKGDGDFEQLGGTGYLADLVDQAPPSSMAPEYARSIFDNALRRELIHVCEDGLKRAREDHDVAAFEVAVGLRSEIEQVERSAAPGDASMIDAPQAAENAIAKMREAAAHGRPRGLMTGLRCIDRRCNGLKPEALVVIGGRPGMSKTGLARAIVHGAAVRNPEHRFLFLGIEMGPEEMMQRELSALTYERGDGDGVEYRAMASGSLTAMDFMNIDDAFRRVPANLTLDDCAALSIEDVERKVWALSRRGKIGAIVIDYLQLMRRPKANGRNEASVLGEITMRLKQLARRFKITIILLSQLSRQVESRDDKRPTLADLRESGSIEQDADVVLFPFREFYYLQKAEPPATQREKYLDWEMRCSDTRRRLDVICGKQRAGPEGTDRQSYHAEFDFITDGEDDR